MTSSPGGANADDLNGEGGFDRLVAFRGSNDVVNGGTGDDVMVWNNGDGTDINNGDAGIDEVEVNGAPTAGDAFIYKPDPAVAGRVQFNRTNLIGFGINLSAERLTVNGLGGDDGRRRPIRLLPVGLAPRSPALTAQRRHRGGRARRRRRRRSDQRRRRRSTPSWAALVPT